MALEGLELPSFVFGSQLRRPKNEPFPDYDTAISRPCHVVH